MAIMVTPQTESFKQAVSDLYGDDRAPAVHPQLPQVLATARAAQAKLPQAGERIAKAVGIVLEDGVQPSPMVQGGWRVQSQGTADAYEVHDNTCTCPDYQYRSADDPQMVCKHVIASWLYRRAQQPVQATGCTPQPVPPLPEAPASVNVRLTLHGREVQMTLRDTDEGRLLERLEALLQRIPGCTPPAPTVAPAATPAPAPSTPAKDWCAVHHVAMKLNEKDGRTWYSHKTDQGWCKGK